MSTPNYDHDAHVTFVIPTYNRRDALDETLACLARVEHAPGALEVVVVDDGSEDVSDVVDRHRGVMPRLRLVRQPGCGAAMARNRGAREASGELLIFLDDDILVEPDHVARHLAAQARLGPCLQNGSWRFADPILARMNETPFGRYRVELEHWMIGPDLFHPIDDTTCELPSLTSANLCMPASIFHELGGFDEDFPAVGFEDIEFSMRAAAAGHRLLACLDIVVWHNDQRHTFREFCERQRQSARGAVLMASKFPAWATDRPFIVQGLPVARIDGPRLMLKKTVKRVLSTDASLALLHAVVALVERARPTTSLLHRLYWYVTGLYIFRGVREGIAATPEVTSAVRAELQAAA